MRRKILQDHANTLCQMLVGWRMGDDISKFSSLGTGILKIDILNRKCTHNDNYIDGLYIVDELNAWFLNQLKKHQITSNDIQDAFITSDIEVHLEASKKKATKVHLKWDIVSVIETNEKKYEGRLKETHTWAGAI